MKRRKTRKRKRKTRRRKRKTRRKKGKGKGKKRPRRVIGTPYASEKEMPLGENLDAYIKSKVFERDTRTKAPRLELDSKIQEEQLLNPPEIPKRSVCKDCNLLGGKKRKTRKKRGGVKGKKRPLKLLGIPYQTQEEIPMGSIQMKYAEMYSKRLQKDRDARAVIKPLKPEPNKGGKRRTRKKRARS